MSKESDGWETPQDLIQYLTGKYDINFDLCATDKNHKLPKYSSDIFSLSSKDFSCKETGFMNPPYSNPGPFLKKAWELALYGKIVCLVPISVLSAKYFDIFDLRKVEDGFYVRKLQPGVTIRYLPRRVKFTHPTKKVSSPSFGCMLLILDRRQ